VRRGSGAGKPASLYQLTDEAETRFSRAYAPVLTALLEELATRLPAPEADALVRNAGRRLAASLPARTAALEERVRQAAALLHELGADITIEREAAGLRIRGSGCPLSATVVRRPEACRAVQGLLAEVIGSPVEICCEREPRPSCCFRVSSAA
jgi:predicted ArsR family transcriptional regulator